MNMNSAFCMAFPAARRIPDWRAIDARAADHLIICMANRECFEAANQHHEPTNAKVSANSVVIGTPQSRIGSINIWFQVASAPSNNVRL